MRLRSLLAVLLLAGPLFVHAQQRDLTLIRQWEPIDPRFGTVGDLDKDVGREIVVATRSRRELLVLRDADSPRGYAVAGRVVGGRNDSVAGMTILDVDGDGRNELLVAWFGSRLAVHDGTTLQLRAQTALTDIRGFSAADVDGDGLRELLVRRGNTLQFRDPVTLQLRGSMPFAAPVDSSAIQVVDVHGDARPEVVTADGEAWAIQRDGTQYTATRVWTTPRGALRYFAPVDTDDDGKSEIVAARFDGSVGIERISPAPAWQQIATHAINYGLDVEDLDEDGDADVMVVCGCAGADVVAMTLQGTELWRISNPLLEGAGVGRLPDGRRYLLEIATHSLVARAFPTQTGPAWSLGADVNQQTRGVAIATDAGQARLAWLVSPTPFVGQRVATVDVWDRSLRDIGGSGNSWLPEPPSYPLQASAREILAIDDIGRPGERFLIVGMYLSQQPGIEHSTWLWAMDERGQFARQQRVDVVGIPAGAARSRVAGEDKPRVALGLWLSNNSARLVRVGIDDGVPDWQSQPEALENGVPLPMIAADLDGDGSDELIAQFGTDVRVYQPAVGTTPVGHHTGVVAFAVLSGAKPRLLLARIDGSVSVHKGLAASATAQVQLGFWPRGLGAHRDPVTGEELLSALDGGILRIHRLADGLQLASSQPPTFVSGKIHAHDLDGDARMEIIVGAHVFRLRSGDDLHASGFE